MAKLGFENIPKNKLPLRSDTLGMPMSGTPDLNMPMMGTSDQWLHYRALTCGLTSDTEHKKGNYINTSKYNTNIDTGMRDKVSNEEIIKAVSDLSERLHELESRFEEIDTIERMEVDEVDIKKTNEENLRITEEIMNLPEGDPRRDVLIIFKELDGILGDCMKKNTDPAKYIYSRDR